MAAMSRSVRFRLFAVIGALALGTSGALVGLGVSAGAQNAAPARPVVRLASTPTLDHFTCYTAVAVTSATRAATFAPPGAVELFNQFAPQGLWTAVGRVALHCNPVTKTVLTTPPSVTNITNPNAHLLCFTTPPVPAAAVVTQPTYKVTATNQFGSALLDTGGQPVLLCLPTWKNLSTKVAPGQVQVQPPGLDHFLCYPASYDNTQSRFSTPPLTLNDEFMKTKAYPAVTVTPNLLCLPTAKALSPLVGAPQVNFADPHLVCFSLKVGRTPTPGVYDQNQFGNGVVTTKKLIELCVPSTKSVSSPGGQIVITKVDATGIPLIGAVFNAYATTDPTKTTSLGTCTTGAAGVCTIAPLLPAPASYVISETTPPPGGYVPSPDQTVTITSSPGTAAVTFTDCLPSAAGGCPFGGTRPS